MVVFAVLRFARFGSVSKNAPLRDVFSYVKEGAFLCLAKIKVTNFRRINNFKGRRKQQDDIEITMRWDSASREFFPLG